MHRAPLLEMTPAGLYCAAGDFYIDPLQRVPRALITHAHSDHARWGMGAYLSHRFNEGVLRKRLGSEVVFQGVTYGEVVDILGVKVSFHPAGHIPGSAQIRLEQGGDVWVVSGDYKCHDDGISTPFEPVKCRVFYTESTFALPVFHWGKSENVFAEIQRYWRACRDRGEHLVLQAYSLGKAQRLLEGLERGVGKVYCHGAVVEMNEALAASGGLGRVGDHFWDYGLWGEGLGEEPGLWIAPSSGISEGFLRKLGRYRVAQCSGWMALRGRQRWDHVDCGFVLSDHADWKELLWACGETGAEEVRPVHGYTEVLSRWFGGVVTEFN
jgi:putative mRNA 3-end processing factor